MFLNDLHLGRMREIAEVLARHSLGYVTGVVGIERLTPFRRGGVYGSGRSYDSHLRASTREASRTDRSPLTFSLLHMWKEVVTEL